MQVFAVSPCPEESAKRLWVNGNRARKMITETQQILACCQQQFLGKVTIKKTNGEPFKTPLSRMNHPVVIWARSDTKHASWITDHLFCLRRGYEGDAFANVYDNYIELLKYSQFIEELRGIKFYNFAKASDKGLDFRHVTDVHEAYDKFLKAQGD